MQQLATRLIALLGLCLTTLALSTLGQAAPIDINTAPADALAANLTGIGPKQAAAIVDYRTTHGPFQSPDELTQIKGIGAKTVAANHDVILLQLADTSTQPSPVEPPAAGLAVPTVNINTADADELARLQNIGPAKAAAIIEYRKANGPFGSVEELTGVKGIGAKTVARNRDMITL